MKADTVCICVLLLSLSMNLWGGGASQSPGGGVKPAVYQRDPNLNAPGTFPINKQKVPLKVGVQQHAMVEDWETNWMTLQIEKKGNYDLSFEIYPSGELNQKLELMVMAGGTDLPDVVWGSFNIATLTKFGQAGMIIPVNDYYKNSAYWINQTAKEIDLDCLKYVTSYDGNIYGIYAIMVSLNNELSPARIMIYEPWLKKLGLDMPQTIDQYLEVLRAFRDRDPNGNGQKDEIPLAGQRDNMMSNYLKAMMTPFIYTQDNFWILNNGKIDVAFNKPQWREGLGFTKKLIDEGLLSPLSFTQDAPQLTAMVSPNPPKVGSFVGVSASMLGGNDSKRTEYLILPPLEGPGGRQQVWRPSLPDIRMIITKNCKTPESAFMLGDLMCGEELSVATRWGEKGVDWVVPEAGEKSVYDSVGYAAIIKPVTPWGPLQNKWYGQNGPYIVSAKWPVGQIPNGPYDHNVPIGRSIGPAIQFANRNPVVGLVYNEQEQELINDLHTTILTYVTESFARFVVGDLSIDRNWDSYVAEFDKMGLQDVIRVTQSAYDRMNK
jgi:putative aldouronate transport system substrate-binding protein